MDYHEHGFDEEHSIRASLASTEWKVNCSLEEYRFDIAAHQILQVFLGDFCDWYLEVVKLRLNFESSEEERERAKSSLLTLIAIFERSLRLLSPFMPFIYGRNLACAV